MRIVIFIVLLLFVPPGNSATLHIENNSRYLAVIIQNTGGYPCLHPPETVNPCLVPPQAHFAYELVDDEVANERLFIVSMPAQLDATHDALNKHPFKSVASYTYRPSGPLRYEQLTCHTPTNEGIGIRLVLEGIVDVTCNVANDQRVTWVYKRNDINLKLILYDLPALKNPYRSNP
ncbi:hypothetical protein FJD38_07545 [Pseudomonas saxonica]|uniref:Uncharacterized protein n=1 Tax=Pseudomonas saxonica TaxID=2600598 RepID=A0ABY3GIW6_9PSED|nr:hypothetical protein [Pseudomonas saxonica]TWR90921.1 hypothetical protein FJD38_07545 [Pseudomonas saxonica]